MVKKIKGPKIEMEKIQVLESNDYFDKVQLVEEWGAEWLPEGIYKHVSLSHESRLPSWAEIKAVKEKYFGDVTVIQVLPDSNRYVNLHPYCMHLWKYIEPKKKGD